MPADTLRELAAATLNQAQHYYRMAGQQDAEYRALNEELHRRAVAAEKERPRGSLAAQIATATTEGAGRSDTISTSPPPALETTSMVQQQPSAGPGVRGGERRKPRIRIEDAEGRSLVP